MSHILPSQSIMVRDPAGIDPDGVDDSQMRLEPTGSRVEEKIDEAVIAHQKTIEGLKKIDVTKLIGVPPPPPKHPPPPRRTRRSRASAKATLIAVRKDSVPKDKKEVSSEEDKEATLRTRNLQIFPEDDGIPAPPVAPRDVHKTLALAEERRKAALAMYQSEELVLDKEEEIVARELLRPAMQTLENKQPAVPKSGNASLGDKISSLGVPSSPRTPSSPCSEATRPRSNKTNRETDQNQHPELREIIEFPSHEPPSTVDSSSLDEKKPERRRRGFSLDRERPDRRMRGFSLERKRGDKNSKSQKEGKQKKGFFKKLFRGRGRERGASQERGADPPIQRSPAAEKPALPTPRREPQVNAIALETLPTPKLQTPLKPALKRAEDRNYQGQPVMQTDNKEGIALLPSTYPSPKSESVSSSPRYAVASPMAAESVVLPAPTPSVSSVGSQSRSLKTFSQDPPDDEHGDPPEYSGPPLLSPSGIKSLQVTTSEDEDEQCRVESVRSRIAEVYEGHLHAIAQQDENDAGPITGVPISLSNDNPDYFFANDELSALTGPSFEALHNKSKSFDLSVASGSENQEPLEELGLLLTKADSSQSSPDSREMEPYNAPFSKTSDLNSSSTPTYQSNLHVDINGQSLDPVGASPLKVSARDRQTGGSLFRDPVGESPVAWKNVPVPTNDPVGESPCHAAPYMKQACGEEAVGAPVDFSYFDDPPLNTSLISDASSFVPGAEEKKEDDRGPGDDNLMAEGEMAANVLQQSGEEVATRLQKLTDVPYVDDPPLNTSLISDATTFVPGAEDKKDKSGPETLNSITQEPDQEEKTRHGEHPTEDKPPAFGDRASSSKAIRAALKLVKTTGTGAIKQELAAIPTPTNSDSTNQRMGSTPNLDTKTLAKTTELLTPTQPKNESQSLEVMTKIESSGFRSGQNTPSSTSKSLTVTAAAFTNAKAVAYLHRLHGEPSPRHSWHVGKARQQPESSPPAVAPVRKERIAKKEKTPSQKKPCPYDYGAHTLVTSRIPMDDSKEDQLSADESSAPKNAPEDEGKPLTPEERLKKKYQKTKVKDGSMFSAYNSKFRGRDPSKLRAAKSGFSFEQQKPEAFALNRGEMDIVPHAPASPVFTRTGKITGLAVAKGIELRRNKRKDDIATGKSAPVIITPRSKPTGGNRFKFVPANETEIRDPIQRAGRRLLSKAAIPIQTAARGYIAKRASIDRMWALIQIQSYCRRWRCETNLQASIHSATVVQACFRGWSAREGVKDMQYSAIQIQKVMRGYLASLLVYDTIYFVVRIQAAMRGCYGRKMYAKKLDEANRMAIPIQTLYRGYKARQQLKVAISAVSSIQSTWRSYSASISFQFQVVDVIIVQSIVRRWAAHRRAEEMKKISLFSPASKVQATWRGYSARSLYKEIIAAKKIQATWRGFQCYTDYIFNLVDILVAQRTVRQWLAIRKVNALRIEKEALRREQAALILQTNWRRHKAQVTLLYSLVHIIIAQSVARRWLSRFAVRERNQDVLAIRKENQRKHAAAAAIQKAWRGFWEFSHYIIVQYEITKLQAVIRGNLVRQDYNLKLGCAIIIQGTLRRYLAKTLVRNLATKRTISTTLATASALELRERNAAKRIQFWWRIVLDWLTEKKAAMTIERFFVHVREEVDREVIRRERKKIQKKKRRKSKKRRESDEQSVESEWMNAVDKRLSSSSGSKNSPLTRAASPTGKDLPHRSPAIGRLSSPIGDVYRPETDAQGWPIRRNESVESRGRFPTEAVHVAPSEDFSEMSNITTPSVLYKMGHHGSRHSKPGHSDTERRQSRDNRMSTQDYIKKYGGLKTAPNRLASEQPKHFFSEEGLSTTPHHHPVTQNAYAHTQTPFPTPRSSVGSAYANGQTPTTTPRSSVGTPTSKRRSSSGTPRSHGMTQTPGMPLTPRSGSGNLPTPRSHVSAHVKDRQSFYPPVTPTRERGTTRRADKLPEQHHIARGETAETESQTTMSHTTFSKSSPRAYQSQGQKIHHSPVMVMKTYPNFQQAHSIEEAQELLYLGDDYGEV